MGRIVTPVTVTSYADPARTLTCDALVDAGAAHLVLPSAWRDKLGKLDLADTVTIETADQRALSAEICGPVRVEIEGFRAVSTDVVFLDMQPGEHGRYEPLVGYLVLEAIPAAVDMLGHRLVPVKHFDLKLHKAPAGLVPARHTHGRTSTLPPLFSPSLTTKEWERVGEREFRRE